MKIRIPLTTEKDGGPIYIQKEDSDVPAYRGGRLMYHVKNKLNAMFGLTGRKALIKVKMGKHIDVLKTIDSHYIVNGDHARNGIKMAIVDNKAKDRVLYKAYNAGEEVELWMILPKNK